MVRIFAPPERLLESRATLDESAHRHLIKVLRLQVGATLRVFDGQGTEIDAQIEHVGQNTVSLVLGARRRLPPPKTTITLFQSPPKNDRMEYIVQKTTELGVARIVPILTSQGIMKPSAERCARWRTIAREAARQCGRAEVPVIEEAQPLELVLHSLPAPTRRILLWEEERKRSIREALENGPTQVALMVGPEGGWSEIEVNRCLDAGFMPTTMGPLILRADTAAIVAVALAQAAAGGLE
jgi:16S rRNA (uracil1498-N3)-methyltransferase